MHSYQIFNFSIYLNTNSIFKLENILICSSIKRKTKCIIFLIEKDKKEKKILK